MQIHSDHMVHAGDREEVGEHAGRDGTTMTLLLGLARVWEVSQLRVSIHHELSQTGRAPYGITARETS